MSFADFLKDYESKHFLDDNDRDLAKAAYEASYAEGQADWEPEEEPTLEEKYKDIREQWGDCDLKEYTREKYKQFIVEAYDADIYPRMDDEDDSPEYLDDYQGRNFYNGPAIITNDLGGTLAKINIKCRWDNMGLGWVVYPT